MPLLSRLLPVLFGVTAIVIARLRPSGSAGDADIFGAPQCAGQ